MRDLILSRLNDIARQEDVVILYACESGSRGWRFSSADSDYDVRFLYLRRLGSYLSIHAARDVIEPPIAEGLDILGWDFRKALQLLQKSNARLLEWMSSPIVYAPAHDVVRDLWRLAPGYFSPLTCAKYYHRGACHYFSSAIAGDRLHVKAMFYALRMTLAVIWIEQTNTPIPMDFWIMAERLVASSEVRDAVQQLYEAKRQASERAQIAILPALQAYCTGEIQRLETVVPQLDHRAGPDAPLNQLFRRALGLDDDQLDKARAAV